MKNALTQSSQTDSAEVTEQEETTLQNLAAAGGKQMQRDIQAHHAVGPGLSGGDLDANWQNAEATGDEAVGGHAATPDQDSVDEIGHAFGTEISDEQELFTHDEILARRDRHRWELNPHSTDGDFQSNEERK